MFNDQFVDELPDALLRGRDLGVAGLGQNDRLDAEDLGRRAGQAAAIEVRADAVEVPLLQEQALLLEGLDCGGCVSAANSSSAALGIDAFVSAKTSAGTRARFSRMTRRAAGGRGSLADSMTVTSTGSRPWTISHPWPKFRRICTEWSSSLTSFSR